MKDFFKGFEKRASVNYDAKIKEPQGSLTKEEQKKFKAFKMHDRKKWMNPPPDHTETMSPRRFKQWALGTEEGRNYTKLDMGE